MRFIIHFTLPPAVMTDMFLAIMIPLFGTSSICKVPAYYFTGFLLTLKFILILSLRVGFGTVVTI